MNNTTQLSYDKDFDSIFCQENHGLGFTIAGLFFMIFVVVSCLFGNTLVCVASVKFCNLFACSEMFILSLALSDIMVATTVLPFDILYWITFPRWTLGGVLCNLWNSLFFLFLTASVLNLTAISIDRFLAVVYPLRYQTLMTPNLNKFMIACVWIYSFGIGILIFFLLKPPQNERYSFDLNPYLYGFVLIGNVFVPFVIMIVLYSKIYVIARQHAKRLGVATSSIPNTSATSYRKKFARELKIAKTLGIVVLCFVICWLPFEIINVMVIVNKGAGGCAVEIADTMACWLAYVHSSLNPLLYAFASCDFRRAFKKLLCIKREETTGTSLQIGGVEPSETAGRFSGERKIVSNEFIWIKFPPQNNRELKVAATATATKTSLENKHSGNGDYFVIIASSSHPLLLIEHAANGLG